MESEVSKTRGQARERTNDQTKLLPPEPTPYPPTTKYPGQHNPGHPGTKVQLLGVLLDLAGKTRVRIGAWFLGSHRNSKGFVLISVRPTKILIGLLLVSFRWSEEINHKEGKAKQEEKQQETEHREVGLKPEEQHGSSEKQQT